MRFLVDAQLPPALARWLTAQGYEAEHVADLNMKAAPDGSIWQFAMEKEAVIVTKDEDFASLRIRGSGQVPAVVWLRVGNTRRQELLRWFELMFPRIVMGLNDGEKLIEVR